MKPSINKILKHTTEIEIETLRLRKQEPEHYYTGLINAICTLRKEIEQFEKPLKINTNQYKEQTTREITKQIKQQKGENTQ